MKVVLKYSALVVQIFYPFGNAYIRLDILTVFFDIFEHKIY